MMNYVVTAEGDLMDAELHTNDAEEAANKFSELCECGLFYDVQLYDGETGEVYAYQTIVKSPSGTTLTRWMAE